MEIIKYPDKKLREKSEEVKFPISDEDKKTLTELYRFVKDPDNKALGLSAIQIGVAKRLCAVRYDDLRYKLVNPRIVFHSTTKASDTEGCLSVVPDVDCMVPRWTSVRVSAFDLLTNKQVIIDAKGYFARILQHEIDHMDGKLYIDYAKEEN